MKHAVLFGYVLLFSSGFVGIGAAVLMYLKSRNRYLPAYIVYLGAVTVFIALTTIAYYQNAILSGRSLLGALVESSLVSGAAAALYFVVLRTAHQYLEVDVSGWRLAPLLAVCCVYLAGAVLMFFLGEAVRRVLFVLSTLILAYLGVLGLLRAARKPDAEERRMIRTFATLLLVFLPLSAVEFRFEFSPDSPYHPFAMDHVLYFLLNLFTVVFAARSLLSRAGGALLADVPAELRARFGITGREGEMAVLIARGLANKQIAAELGISEKTVRTHIYNLFRKCGVGSRIELINRLLTPASQGV